MRSRVWSTYHEKRIRLEDYEDRLSQRLTSDVIRDGSVSDADADVGGDVHPYRALVSYIH